jgi:hypothetical protein
MAWVVGLAAAVMIAPIIFMAITGIVGLIVAAAVGFAAIKFAPVFSAKVSNLAMKLLKKEAYDNPIPTLLNEYAQRKKEVDKKASEAEEFNNALETYKSHQRQLVKDYPEDAKMFEEHIEGMEVLKNEEYQALKELGQALVQFDKEIKRAERIWNMTLVANKVTSKAQMISQRDAIRKIQTETAFDSVRESMARSFAKVDHVRRMREGGMGQQDQQNTLSGTQASAAPRSALEGPSTGFQMPPVILARDSSGAFVAQESRR